MVRRLLRVCSPRGKRSGVLSGADRSHQKGGKPSRHSDRRHHRARCGGSFAAERQGGSDRRGTGHPEGFFLGQGSNPGLSTGITRRAAVHGNRGCRLRKGYIRDKDPVCLPRQDMPNLKKEPYNECFCVSKSILPTVYQYFWRARFANYHTRMRRTIKWKSLKNMLNGMGVIKQHLRASVIICHKAYIRGC